MLYTGSEETNARFDDTDKPCRIAMTSTLTVDEHGVREWRDQDGKLHRDDGPAVESPDGSAEWLEHGALTKKLYKSGTIVHYRDVADGPEEDARLVTKHRLDGPAVIRWDRNGRFCLRLTRNSF